MAPSKIQITPPESALAPCASSPQLMPFHIAYSGPAPVATFFRVRELEAEAPPVSSWAAPGSVPADGVNLKTKEASSRRAKIGKRLVAAFRGRRVVGVEVPLPDGYTGLVLRSDAPERPTGLTKESSNGRMESVKTNGNARSGRKASTRRTRRSKPIEVDDDDAEQKERRPDVMDIDDIVDQSLTLSADSNAGEVRTLKATQTFQSLLVWNADVAVDEGRDEYIRALREWTALAAEVHRVEE